MGLAAFSSHVGHKDLTTNLDFLIETHNLWNCQSLSLGALPRDMRTPAGYRTWASEGYRIARRLAARVPSVHFKDMGIADDKQVLLEVGEGNLNWPAILDACRAAGTRYVVFEQDTSLRDPFESAHISLANLRAMGLHP